MEEIRDGNYRRPDPETFDCFTLAPMQRSNCRHGTEKKGWVVVVLLTEAGFGNWSIHPGPSCASGWGGHSQAQRFALSESLQFLTRARAYFRPSSARNQEGMVSHMHNLRLCIRVGAKVHELSRGSRFTRCINPSRLFARLAISN